MSELRAIRIERGPQGFGGPLIIRPTEQKNKVMYITGGGTAPDVYKRQVFSLWECLFCRRQITIIYRKLVFLKSLTSLSLRNSCFFTIAINSGSFLRE